MVLYYFVVNLIEYFDKLMAQTSIKTHPKRISNCNTCISIYPYPGIITNYYLAGYGTEKKMKIYIINSVYPLY